jgi:hypothetical protein
MITRAPSTLCSISDLLQVVDEPARRRHHNLDASPEVLPLLVHLHAPDHDGRAQAAGLAEGLHLWITMDRDLG